ncbi:Uncharacterised protein [Amycolatopsis camponoti]|uniref:Uncharacterized protein n=1 Tax=Amycolatopsis camponoti TaxID=2606593 RepID=A0A6I8LQC4_9PSEU|nr:Uncharacterised protein [Amycolatopsis camponoti]
MTPRSPTTRPSSAAGGVWPVFYAVLDRTRAPSMCNARAHVDGYFSTSATALP